MSSERCDGCDRRVPVGGGIANLWTTSGRHTAGMTLELADGSEHFLCFDCIDELDDDPTAADVAALPDQPRDEPVSDRTDEDAGVGGVGAGVALGAVVGASVAVALDGALEPWLATGAAVGLGVALLVDAVRGD